MLVQPVGPISSSIYIVGEAPGSAESKHGKPFIGPSGRTLDRLLGMATIMRAQCRINNVAKQQPPGNKMEHYFYDKDMTLPKPELVKWINELKADLTLCQPNVIIALGNHALWALTGLRGISKYRGYILPCKLVPGLKVMPTLHPSHVMQSDGKPDYFVLLDLRKAMAHSRSKEITYPCFNLTYNPSVPEFVDYCDELSANSNIDYVACDIENTQPGTHITEIGFAHRSDTAMTLSLVNGRIPKLNENEELKVMQAICRVLRNKKIIMQNASHDIGVLYYNNGILVRDLWMDTLIAAHVCWPEFPRDLGFLASICLDVYPWKHEKNRPEYNPLDAANTYGIAMYLDKEIDRLNVRHTFNFEMREIPAALMLQLQGIPVDPTRQKEIFTATCNKIRQLYPEIQQEVGYKINVTSPKQMQQYLYEERGLPTQYKRRKSVNEPRRATVDKEALTKLKRMFPNDKVFEKILELRQMITLLRFVGDDKILVDEGVLPKSGKSTEKMALSPEGRVHTSYNITGSAVDDEGRKSFGRWSSSKSIILPYGSGNLQNIPPEARKMYAAPEGYVIVQGDYIQAEAVLVAYFIHDVALMNMFKKSFGMTAKERQENGYDVHRYTASTMFGIPPQEVTKAQRAVGKTLRHAVNYSAGPKVIANKLQCDMTTARKLLDIYMAANPNLKTWHTQIRDKLAIDKTLETPLGRKHRFTERWGDNLFRSAYAYMPQSTVGDMLNMSLVELYEQYGDIITTWLQLHDAIYTICKEKDVDYTMQTMYNCMIRPIFIDAEEVVVDVDFKVGPTWGDMEEVELAKTR